VSGRPRTIRYYTKLLERAEIGDSLLSAEGWDRARRVPGAFEIPETREQWEVLAAEPHFAARAARVVETLRGAHRVVSYGVGGASLELHLARLVPELVCCDFAPDATARLASIFPEADVVQHDFREGPLEGDAHLLHRVDAELSNAEWESVLPRFRTGPVLFIACALSDRIGVRARLRSRFGSRGVLAGYMRNRAALEELLTASHRIASSGDFAGLPGWLLEPAEA
jgi:hypothetical protein